MRHWAEGTEVANPDGPVPVRARPPVAHSVLPEGFAWDDVLGVPKPKGG